MERKGFNLQNNIIKGVKNLSYIEQAVLAHNKIIDLNIRNLKDNDSINVHKVYYQYMANHILNLSNHINRNQVYVVRNLENCGIHTLSELKIFKDRNFSLEAHQIWNSFPIHGRTIINRSRRWETYLQQNNEDEICIDFNKWVKKTKMTNLELKKQLATLIKRPKLVDSINLKYNTTLDMNENPLITYDD
jgi:hypothetical protein